MFFPKLVRKNALKQFCHYLIATSDKGLIMTHSEKLLMIDSLCYTDFAGTYEYDDTVSAKSRIGYMITVAKYSIMWQTKYQSKIALSIMEAEIVALAHSCLKLFPIMD